MKADRDPSPAPHPTAQNMKADRVMESPAFAGFGISEKRAGRNGSGYWARKIDIIVTKKPESDVHVTKEHES